MKIKYLGRELPRKKNGQWKRKNGNVALLALIFVVTVSSVVFIAHPKVMAKIDDMSARLDTTVTAEVALDCTSPTHLYEMECIRRFTDPMAESRAFFEEARNNRIKAQEVEDEAFEMMNQDIENYNSVYGVVVDEAYD